MKDIGSGVVTILASIIGVATLAVILSKKSATSSVLKSFGDAFGSILKAAVSPVSQ